MAGVGHVIYHSESGLRTKSFTFLRSGSLQTNKGSATQNRSFRRHRFEHRRVRNAVPSEHAAPTGSKETHRRRHATHPDVDSRTAPVLTGLAAASASTRKLCCSMRTGTPVSASCGSCARRSAPSAAARRVRGGRRRLGAPQSCADSASLCVCLLCSCLPPPSSSAPTPRSF